MDLPRPISTSISDCLDQAERVTKHIKEITEKGPFWKELRLRLAQEQTRYQVLTAIEKNLKVNPQELSRQILDQDIQKKWADYLQPSLDLEKIFFARMIIIVSSLLALSVQKENSTVMGMIIFALIIGDKIAMAKLTELADKENAILLERQQRSQEYSLVVHEYYRLLIEYSNFYKKLVMISARRQKTIRDLLQAIDYLDNMKNLLKGMYILLGIDGIRSEGEQFVIIVPSKDRAALDQGVKKLTAPTPKP